MLSRRQINVIFGTVMLGMLLAALDQTIAPAALPTIVGDLGGPRHLSWVVTACLLADTVASVLAGKDSNGELERALARVLRPDAVRPRPGSSPPPVLVSPRRPPGASLR